MVSARSASRRRFAEKRRLTLREANDTDKDAEQWQGVKASHGERWKQCDPERQVPTGPQSLTGI
jgi:hypothetical protein